MKDSSLLLRQIYPLFGNRPRVYRAIDLSVEFNTSASARKLYRSLTASELYLLDHVLIDKLASKDQPTIDLYDYDWMDIINKQLIHVVFEEEYDMNASTYKRSINKLTDLNIIIRHKRGSYFINPHYINAIKPDERTALTNTYNVLVASVDLAENMLKQ